jgi:hypothetical protein
VAAEPLAVAVAVLAVEVAALLVKKIRSVRCQYKAAAAHSPADEVVVITTLQVVRPLVMAIAIRTLLVAAAQVEAMVATHILQLVLAAQGAVAVRVQLFFLEDQNLPSSITC